MPAPPTFIKNKLKRGSLGLTVRPRFLFQAFRPRGFADATAVYMLSTAFGHGTFNRFMLALAAATNLRWVISSKAIPTDLLGAHNAKRGHRRIVLHTKVVVPTSWNPACSISIYKVTEAIAAPEIPQQQQQQQQRQQGELHDAIPGTTQLPHAQMRSQTGQGQTLPEPVLSPQDSRRRERQRVKDAARRKRSTDL